METENFATGIPYKLLNEPREQQCVWLNTHDKTFTEPFFDETIAKLRFLDPKNRSQPFVCSLDEMARQGHMLEDVTPSVIIFHVSRCGSTLISQLFATSGRYIVLSEVPFFDNILRLSFSVAEVDETKIPEYFLSALNFYGRKRDTNEENVVIKTDCWHIFFYKALRKLFPATPFVLMYRSPDEVLRSNLKKPGWQTIPELVDPRIFGLPGISDTYQRDVYTGTIIEKMLAKFLEVAQADDKSLLVNYNEGAMPILKKIAAFARLNMHRTELLVMEERARYHSKNPDELFSEEAINQIPPCLYKAMDLYHKLEEKRSAILFS